MVSIWAECRLDFKTMHHGQRDRVRFALECVGSLKHRYAPIGRAACFDRTPPSGEINRKISDLRHSRSVGAVLNFGLQKGERPHEPPGFLWLMTSPTSKCCFASNSDVISAPVDSLWNLFNLLRPHFTASLMQETHHLS